MRVTLGSDEVSVERCSEFRKNVGKTNSNNKLLHWILCFFPIIAPLATQNNIAGCHFRLNLCLEAQLHSHIHPTRKYGLLLKSGSACLLCMLVLSKINSQSWFVQQVLAVVCEGREYGGGQGFVFWQQSAGVFFMTVENPLRLKMLGLDFPPSEAGALLFWSSAL